MKYIKLFENHSDYESFTGSTDFIEPNVSQCIEENDVHYSILAYVDGVRISDTAITINMGGYATLEAIISPEYATNKNVTWSTSDDTVAAVDSDNGVVSTVGEGTATITVTTEDGGFTAACEVTITNIKHVDEVVLNTNTLTMNVGDEETLVATVYPVDATDKSVTWESSDPSVATVEDGVVTAIAAGSAVIIVTTVDGELTATCDVTVETV